MFVNSTNQNPIRSLELVPLSSKPFLCPALLLTLKAAQGLATNTECDEEEKEEEQVALNENRLVFKQRMEESFLLGKDIGHFDYITVDGNTEYDDLDQQTIDAQEDYFDEESAGEEDGTGMLDYYC